MSIEKQAAGNTTVNRGRPSPTALRSPARTPGTIDDLSRGTAPKWLHFFKSLRGGPPNPPNRDSGGAQTKDW